LHHFLPVFHIKSSLSPPRPAAAARRIIHAHFPALSGVWPPAKGSEGGGRAIGLKPTRAAALTPVNEPAAICSPAAAFRPSLRGRESLRFYLEVLEHFHFLLDFSLHVIDLTSVSRFASTIYESTNVMMMCVIRSQRATEGREGAPPPAAATATQIHPEL